VSESYAKLFSTITVSTIWGEPLATRCVWITMLAIADRNGVVQASVPGLARVANVPLEDCEAAIERLLAPDRYSRTPDHEGRRIEVVDGGWRLLNHAKYREKLSTEKPADKSESFVYFMLAGDFIKIGWSKNPWSRCADLQATHGVQCELLHTQKGTKQDEAELHSHFAHLRAQVKGKGVEWFRIGADLLDHIDSVAGRSATETLRARTRSDGSATKADASTDTEAFFVGSSEASTGSLAGKSTDAGRACRLMREAGCIHTNPSHPELVAAIAEGVTGEALADTVREGIEAGKKKPFAWAISTARSRHADAIARAASANQVPRGTPAPSGAGPPMASLSKTGAAFAALNQAADHLDPQHGLDPRTLVSRSDSARALPTADAEP
jgi:hypothetical protein